MVEEENSKMTRKEEPTLAPTPDKLDRSQRAPGRGERESNKENASKKPYPLTEEEATPNVSGTQQKKEE